MTKHSPFQTSFSSKAMHSLSGEQYVVDTFPAATPYQK